MSVSELRAMDAYMIVREAPPSGMTAREVADAMSTRERKVVTSTSASSCLQRLVADGAVLRRQTHDTAGRGGIAYRYYVDPKVHLDRPEWAQQWGRGASSAR